MGKLFAKLFGTYSERQIKRISAMADKIEDLAEKYVDEEGEYTVTVKNRTGYSYSFKIIIAENKEITHKNDQTEDKEEFDIITYM